mmetsp:Transcript_3602/g.10362  ORF Transcript_3602/g.10362 Transcript_3602/m.10362 type:complete len:340 (+) Transcript_3602:56-1075(+)
MGVCASTPSQGVRVGPAVFITDDEEEPEWLDVGLVNAFDDPPEPYPDEESASAAGDLRPPNGWRHSLPNYGIYTPVQWGNPIPCGVFDWASKRSACCCCLLPCARAAVHTFAPRASTGLETVDVLSPDWVARMGEHLASDTTCPIDLDGWWWADGDVLHGGDLLTLHDADWSSDGRSARQPAWASRMRANTCLGLCTTASALLSGSNEEYTFDAGRTRAYVAPGRRWLFRLHQHEWRVVEFADPFGATNAVAAMWRLRRVLTATRKASTGKVEITRLPALAEYLARARAVAPHPTPTVVELCCGSCGAPIYGCGIGPAERLDNAVVPVNPRAHVMLRRR